MDLSEIFWQYFSDLSDPRLDNHNHRPNLQDILLSAILGSICGADGWAEISRFGETKHEWLKTFLEFPNGIPSHDTFGHVFSLINPDLFEACFGRWIKSLSIDIKNKVIAIDGKTLRGLHDRKKGHKSLHLVSAWASEQQTLLGQVKTPEKTNEINAIPELLDLLDLQGSTITIDAMGCQKTIADQIIKKGANYVLALKENQQTLHADVSSIFAQGKERQYKKMLHRRTIMEYSPWMMCGLDV